MRLRPYLHADKPACLAVFASNLPKFFAAHETAEFAAFLDRLPCPYLVLENDQGEIVGCGGHFLEADGQTGGLAWGLVAQGLHRQGLGRLLLRARLKELARQAEVQKVGMFTSQHSAAFFLREGFLVTENVPDGIAPGIDMVRLVLPMDLERRKRLLEGP